jgi:NAD(P)-dependent dehydrogenase (short-subunit alcohol dehydrogenase family)
MSSIDPQKTVLVTGANKGIGYEIVRQMARAGWRVFLGARDRQRGEQARARLAEEKLNVDFLELDVSRPESIAQAAERLTGELSSLDALVNNAGVLNDEGASIVNIDPDLIHRTLDTNTFGPLRLTQRLLPLLEKAADGGRVINLSSGLGQLDDMEDGYPAYGLSKTALNVVTRKFASALKGKKIAVNSVCPGWVKTDMGGAGAHRTVEQGADTVVWLATEAPSELTGQFLRDRKPLPW